MIPEEKELYDFLAQPKEFEQALLVLEHMPKLRWYLLDRFWDDVRDQLDAWNRTHGNKWQFEERDRHHEYWNLSFTKPSWPHPRRGWHVAICWSGLCSKPLLGIWIAENTELYDYHTLRDRLAKLDSLIQGKRNDITVRPSEFPNWWPVMYRPGLDFSESNYQGLIQILPNVPTNETTPSETLATHYAKLAIDWVETLGDAIDQIVMECKNPKP